MDTLTKQQRDILLDYYFECASQQEIVAAQSLLSSHEGAIEFYEKLNHSLSALEHLDHSHDSNCPEHLVENLLDKVYADTSGIEAGSIDQLGKLLKAESEKDASSSNSVVTTRTSFWRSILETAAVAAGILILSGLFVPVTRNMRAHAWQAACQANLANISQGVTQYASDHAGYMPAVATTPGNPWWKVGSTQPENHSNTRHIWLLVKNNYVSSEAFLCRGCNREKVIKLSPAQAAGLFDFPDRRFISYSSKLICEPNRALMPKRVMPLMSDANPIFEASLNQPNSLSRRELGPIELSERLLKLNSSNHRSKGQNIMFSDGTVKFITQRVFDGNDDIFTVTNLRIYRGTERPACEKDVFLVP